MIINYDRNPTLSIDQKLQSLMENIQLALNEMQLNQDEMKAELIALMKEKGKSNETNKQTI